MPAGHAVFGSPGFRILLGTQDLETTIGILIAIGRASPLRRAVGNGLKRGLPRARLRAVSRFRKRGLGRAIFGGITKRARGAFKLIRISKMRPVGQVTVRSGLELYGLAAMQETGDKTRPHMIFPHRAPRTLRKIGRTAARKQGTTLTGGQVSEFGAGHRWRRRAVINIPGIGYRRWARHPGSRVPQRRFGEQAIDAEAKSIRRELERSVGAHLQKETGRAGGFAA